MPDQRPLAIARIVELSAYHVRIPLRRRIRHATYERTQTDNVIVRCVLDDGTVGHGEGVPRDYVTGETIDSTLALLANSPLAQLVEQSNTCRDFASAVRLAEECQLAAIPGDERGCQGNAARCALELALLDAYGRRFAAPLSSVTALLAPELFDPQPRVQYSGAITTANPWKIRLVGWIYWLLGFHQVKVKVGITGQDDVRRLRRIRRCVGERMDLRLDANEAYAPEEVIARLTELLPFRPSAIEQPVAHDQVQALASLREPLHRLQLSIILDESLCSPVDAERAVREGLCDLFNLRLSKCGGYIPTLRLMQFATRHGLACQLGCQVGETALLSAAGRHFATSVAGLRYLEGSYDRHLVREALGKKDLTFGRGGWAQALTEPGLGVEIDKEALARVTIRQVALETRHS